ncbi:MAG: hypothetical protein ABIQ49_00895 [Gemmatimonadales bacterium]
MLHSPLLQDSVAFRVDLPASAHGLTPIPVVLRLTNKTERPLTLALQDRPIAFDVAVAREDGVRGALGRLFQGRIAASAGPIPLHGTAPDGSARRSRHALHPAHHTAHALTRIHS